VGRHSSGKQNYSLSGGVILAAVAVLALIAVLIWWFGLRSETEQQDADAAGECIQGDLVLPVAETIDGVAEPMIGQWNESDPIVRDHCVTAELVSSPAEAAVVIGPDSPTTEDALGDRTVSSSPAVEVLEAGLVNGSDDTAAGDVTYPVASDPDVAVAVATALAGDDAPGLLSRDRSHSFDLDSDSPQAARQALAASSDDFTPVDNAEVVLHAHILNPAGEITEEQTRAAAEFAEAFDATAEIPDTVPERSAAWAAVDGDSGSEDPAPQGSTEPVDTLLLFDTSDNTTANFGDGTIHTVGADALAALATALGDEGQQVALWNYSSPLNPGVTNGWRRNISFTDAAESAAAVQRFSTGGVPQSRSALVAATAAAAEQARATGEPARVLLLTTGTAQDMDDAAFTSALDQAVGDAEVEISVVHVGDGQPDSVLADRADDSETVSDAADLESTLRSVAGLED